jgi:hypothetical protein
MNKNFGSVYRGEDGKWIAKLDSSSKPLSKHRTQKQAYDNLAENFRRSGGGEISVHGVNGQIREKNTIGPKRDNYPPRG